MKKTLKTFATTGTAAACFLAIGSSAVAQSSSAPSGRERDVAPETGSRIRKASTAATPAEVGGMMKAVAHCSYQANGRLVDKLLAASDSQSVTGKEFGFRSNGQNDNFGISRCMVFATNGTELMTQFFLQPVRLRAMLAEEAYLKRHSVPPTLPAGSGESLARSWVSTGNDLMRAKYLANFSDCVVYRNSQGADAILRTMPGSKEERAAAKALVPVLGPCLVQGQEIALTPIAIRALIADGLWERYVRPAPSVAAK